MKKKKCSKCGVEKDFSEFYKQQRCREGVNSECKLCWKLRVIKKKKEMEQFTKMYIG